MSDRRDKLPNRRMAETLDFKFLAPSGASHPYTAILGYYPDGRLGEVFLQTNKTGTDLFAASQEVGIIASFALQHGCPLSTLHAACPRSTEGRPETALGTLLDILVQRDKGSVKD